MNARKQLILKAIIDEYIATAEPVGSKSLIAKYPLQISAATVRNVMAELEKDGYLEHLHTSSGRTPSDMGYRLYVDQLLDFSQPQVQTLQGDGEVLEQFKQAEDVEEILKSASELITCTTGYTGLALSPPIAKSRLVQMKMLMIEPGKALVILVLAPGLVKDRLIRVPEQMQAMDLSVLSQAIEQELAGKAVEEITWVAVETAARNVSLPETLLNQVLFEAYLTIKQADNMDAYVEGLQNLLSHPEFKDVHKAKSVFDLLMRDGLLSGYLSEGVEDCKQQAGIPFMIRIGQEITLQGMEDCSFVTTTYTLGEKIVGQIGVVGPKRMNYRQVISQIGFVRQMIEKKIKKVDMTHEERKENA